MERELHRLTNTSLISNATNPARTPLKSPPVQLSMSHIFLAGHRGSQRLLPNACFNPPLPFPSPPLWERVSPNPRTPRRGRGGNSDVHSPQGGALRRLPWATIRGPYRAENWLTVRLSGTPCVQPPDLWVKINLGKGGRSEGFVQVVSLAEPLGETSERWSTSSVRSFIRTVTVSVWIFSFYSMNPHLRP